MIESLFRKVAAWLIYGGSFSLRPLERECLIAARSALNQQGKETFDRQLTWLDRYKRLNKGMTVHFFSTRLANGQRLPNEMLFPRKDAELRIARVRFKFSDPNAKPLSAVVALEHGELMSIQFSRLPSVNQGLIVGEISGKLLADPMKLDTETTTTLSRVDEDSWLRSNSERIFNLRSPLGIERRQALVEGLEGRLPQEYLRWSELTNGFNAFGFRMYGLDEIWTAPRPDGTFYVFASSEERGGLAIKANDPSDAIYLLDAQSGLAKPIAGSLAQFLQEGIDQ